MLTTGYTLGIILCAKHLPKYYTLVYNPYILEFICYAKVPASDRGTLDNNSKQRCIAYISYAIRGLKEHRIYLNSLDESLSSL